MRARRFLAGCALVMLLVLHLDYRLLAFPFSGRERLRREFSERPDHNWPEYPRFLEVVSAHTEKGDRIAVIVPDMKWNGGYRYAYFRASYFLAGRQVLPLCFGTDAPIPENLEAADYLAVWQAASPPGRIVWKGRGGVLLARE